MLHAIRQTGYVADPVARRLAARHNRILGVFTYEPVFPTGSRDFYHPFLVGIEECAERLGCDLLLLTSAPVADGRRRIFHDDNRLRLADGCVLLGRRWTVTSSPAWSPRASRSSRSAGATTRAARCRTSAPTTRPPPPPWCGAGRPRSHRLAYVGQGAEAPSRTPTGIAGSPRRSAAAGVARGHEEVGRPPPSARFVAGGGVTALFVEEFADGVAIVQLAKERACGSPTTCRSWPWATRPGRPDRSRLQRVLIRAGRWAAGGRRPQRTLWRAGRRKVSGSNGCCRANR